jgi:hypothetical protein
MKTKFDNKKFEESWVTIKDESGRQSSLRILDNGKIQVVGNLEHNSIFTVISGKDRLIKHLQEN